MTKLPTRVKVRWQPEAASADWRGWRLYVEKRPQIGTHGRALPYFWQATPARGSANKGRARTFDTARRAAEKVAYGRERFRTKGERP